MLLSADEAWVCHKLRRLVARVFAMTGFCAEVGECH